MTKIEWTHREGTKGETWNPIRARNRETGGIGHFCVKVSAGCQNCYAANFQKRFKNTVRYAAQDADQVELFLDETVLMKPLRWKKPRTIFVCSMTDLFYEGHQSDWIDQVFAVMALCPQHTFIILTKRHGRMSAYFQKHFTRHKCGHIAAGITGKLHPGGHNCDPDVCNMQFPLPNVWLGVSVEDQKAADERIPVLLDTPAAVRFLSVEPLLGEISFEGRFYDHPNKAVHLNWLDLIDWVIVGGESGHNARPMHPDWARSLRGQCKAAGVPFFFKQWGAYSPGYSDDNGFVPHADRYLPDGTDLFDRLDPEKTYETTAKVGKKRAGRLLDGIEHNEWPEAAA
ncbi:hypothetical protein TH8_19825 [Thalassospira profundimaris]|nr:hypothetical protein TH8_19825 [Thalassospira profundimaris]